MYCGKISFIYRFEILSFVSGEESEETKEIRIWKLADNFPKKIEVENTLKESVLIKLQYSVNEGKKH